MLLEQRLDARLVFADVLALQQPQRVDHPRVDVIGVSEELQTHTHTAVMRILTATKLLQNNECTCIEYTECSCQRRAA